MVLFFIVLNLDFILVCIFKFFFFIATLFIYFFIFGCVGSSVLARAFSSYGKWGPLFIAVQGPLFIAVRGPLTIAAPPVAGHRLQMRRLSSCGSRAQPLRGMWDLPRPGLEPVSPALAGRFSTTAPPGKPLVCIFSFLVSPLYKSPFPFHFAWFYQLLLLINVTCPSSLFRAPGLQRPVFSLLLRIWLEVPF